MNYRILSPALAEITEAAAYYEEQVSGLGADFIEEVDAAIERIVKFPEAWSQLSESFRHCNLRHFPYTLIYTLQNDNELVIVSVFHQFRDPGSCKDNL